MIPVTPSIQLDERELEERFIRSSGPGGQNVNKVSTAVQLRFDVRAAQGGFMNQMQGHAGGQSVRVQIARPSAQQVPSAQTKVLWNEQPQAQIASRNLIGQQLADFPLQAGGIGGLEALHFAGALRRQQQGRVSGIEGVEFFFEGRNRR